MRGAPHRHPEANRTMSTSKQRAICPACLGLMVHTLPLSPTVRKFASGALGFFAAFLEDRPEKCGECGLLAPWCFRYMWPDEDEWCVHCGLDEQHHANAGHPFRARGVVSPPLDLNPVCACTHRMSSHSAEQVSENRGWCTVPGCACEGFRVEGASAHG